MKIILSEVLNENKNTWNLHQMHRRGGISVTSNIFVVLINFKHLFILSDTPEHIHFSMKKIHILIPILVVLFHLWYFRRLLPIPTAFCLLLFD